jgi:acetyl esterase/lipase
MNLLLPIAFFLIAFSPLALAEEATPSSLVQSTLLPLWSEGKMPGHGATLPEQEQPNAKDGVQRITNVSQPTVEVFPAPGQTGPGPAMIICPGGAYHLLAYNLEGTEIATWLNGLGITGIVLKYRVPDNREGALQDVERAVRLARFHATDWKIDPNRLGVIGFSAGGHLAARLSTSLDQPAYPETDLADHVSYRPNFTILVYPAYLAVNGQIAPELVIRPNIAPTLIVHTEDDVRFVPGSKLYDAALSSAKVPHTFLLYPTGGHGYGLHCQKDAKVWPEESQKWLKSIGIL